MSVDFLHHTGLLANKKRAPRASTIASYESLLRCHVVPRLGGQRLDELTVASPETRSLRGGDALSN